MLRCLLLGVPHAREERSVRSVGSEKSILEMVVVQFAYDLVVILGWG